MKKEQVIDVEVIEANSTEIPPVNELVVLGITPGAITTNFSAFKLWLNESMEEYKTMEVTEDNLKARKADRLKLTNSIKAINARRIEVGKDFKKPLDAYENECKDAIAIIQKQEIFLKKQTDKFDEAQRQKKRDYFIECLTNVNQDESLPAKYKSRLVQPDWLLNVATTNKKIDKYVTSEFALLKEAYEKELQNMALVENQCVSASNMVGLATPITVYDVKGYIGDYETMNATEAIVTINSMATKRKKSEDAAVRRAEEQRIAKEAAEKARAEKEDIRLEMEAKREAEKAKAEEVAKAAKEAALKEELSTAIIEEPEESVGFVPVKKVVKPDQEVITFEPAAPVGFNPLPSMYEYACHIRTTVDDVATLVDDLKSLGYKCHVVARSVI